MTRAMTSADLEARYAFARELVKEAGRLAVDMHKTASANDIETKGPRDFATLADKAVEALIVKRLTEHFGDAVLGEEFGFDREAGALNTNTLWIVDPIDGTYNYMHGNPRWCVSLGLVVDGVATLGFLDAPQSGHFYEARRGTGSFRNGERLQVSGPAMAHAPLVESGTSSRKPLQHYLDTVRRLMEAGIETRRLGSGALGLAQVATGEIDGYLEDHINSWDVAAALVIVTEAGGQVNDFLAGDGIRSGGPILAAAPWLVGRLSDISGVAV
jgi:myo-inositol-1(or 4)-monophosphatase